MDSPKQRPRSDVLGSLVHYVETPSPPFSPSLPPSLLFIFEKVFFDCRKRDSGVRESWGGGGLCRWVAEARPIHDGGRKRAPPNPRSEASPTAPAHPRDGDNTTSGVRALRAAKAA